MNSFCATCLVLMLCGLGAPFRGQPDLPDVYARGMKAFDQKDYVGAAAFFAAATGPGVATLHPDASLMEARCLVHLGQLSEADSVLRHSLEGSPDSAPRLYLLAYVLQRENKPKESLAVLTRAAALAQPEPDDLKIAALDYVLLDDYKDAIVWLNRAVAAGPRNQEAWYDLGRAQMHENDFLSAEASFLRALALKPEDVKALDNLALCYEAQNRVEEALATYPRAIAAQASAAHRSEQPLLNYATLLDTRSRYDEAVPLLLQAIALAPASSRCHEELAHAYIGLKRDDLARSPLQAAVELDPTNPRLHFQLGQLLKRVGRVAQAAAELKRSAELYATHSSEPKDQ